MGLTKLDGPSSSPGFFTHWPSASSFFFKDMGAGATSSKGNVNLKGLQLSIAEVRLAELRLC